MVDNLNADGLIWKYGPAEAGPARVAEYTTNGPRRLVEIIVDADFLPAAGELVIDSYRFSRTTKITNIEVTAEVEDFAAGTSVEVSLVDKPEDNEETLATLTLAQLNDQEESKLDIDLDFVAFVKLTTVGTFTAGKVTVLIEWEEPKVETDTLVWDKSTYVSPYVK